jgi:L1 cell adhesion molecule like protein
MVHGVFSEIVELGKQIPLTRKRSGFTTLVDNAPAVKIEIYRTSEIGRSGKESCRQKSMRFLGDFLLQGIPPAPAGVPRISVSMDIDADGILRVSAELEGAGSKADSVPIHLWVDRELERVETEN